jgi:hypothetical protein
MARQFIFEIAPEPLNQIELGRIGGQKERLEAVGILPPAFPQGMTLVVANVIEHHDSRFISGQFLNEMI